MSLKSVSHSYVIILMCHGWLHIAYRFEVWKKFNLKKITGKALQYYGEDKFDKVEKKCLDELIYSKFTQDASFR